MRIERGTDDVVDNDIQPSCGKFSGRFATDPRSFPRSPDSKTYFKVRESKPSFSHLSNEKVRPHHLRCLEINEENFPDEEERAEELHISKILSYEPNDGEYQSGIIELYRPYAILTPFGHESLDPNKSQFYQLPPNRYQKRSQF